jgi:hypothetical protein
LSTVPKRGTIKDPTEEKERRMRTLDEKPTPESPAIQTVSEVSTPEAIINTDELAIKIESLSDAAFVDLINLLHKARVTEGSPLAAFKDNSIIILKELMERADLDSIIRRITFSRKGLSKDQRRGGEITNFAVYYYKDKQQEDEDTEIGPYTIKSLEWVSAMKAKGKNRNDDEKEDWIEYVATREKALAWIKAQQKSNKDIRGFFQGTETNLDFTTITERLNVTDTFEQNIVSLLFAVYVDASGADYDDRLSRFYPSFNSVGWKPYIPSDRIFVEGNEESFKKSWIALISILDRFYDKNDMKEYSQIFIDIIDDFKVATDKLMEETEKFTYEKDKASNIEELFDQEDDEIDIEKIMPELISNKMGIGSSLEKMHSKLSDMFERLQDIVYSSIIDIIRKVAEDTSGKYMRHRPKHKKQPMDIKSHLDRLGYLTIQGEGEEE